MKVRLLIAIANQPGWEFEVADGQTITVGGLEGSALKLNDPSTAQLQVEIANIDEKATCRNSGEPGPALNGFRISGKTGISSGDKIQLGRATISIVIPMAHLGLRGPKKFDSPTTGLVTKRKGGADDPLAGILEEVGAEVVTGEAAKPAPSREPKKHTGRISEGEVQQMLAEDLAAFFTEPNEQEREDAFQSMELTAVDNKGGGKRPAPPSKLPEAQKRDLRPWARFESRVRSAGFIPCSSCRAEGKVTFHDGQCYGSGVLLDAVKLPSDFNPGLHLQGIPGEHVNGVIRLIRLSLVAPYCGARQVMRYPQVYRQYILTQPYVEGRFAEFVRNYLSDKQIPPTEECIGEMLHLMAFLDLSAYARLSAMIRRVYSCTSEQLAQIGERDRSLMSESDIVSAAARNVIEGKVNPAQRLGDGD
ncbi:MAG TPA: hypothetical protein PL033_20325 [Candidatus Brocadiia bacterium]|nr:hypothetical protein [Candidatus Brocadiia bacterium]